MLKFEPQIVAGRDQDPTPANRSSRSDKLSPIGCSAHKSYIVVPNTTGEDDMGRLKALCSIHGVGLVTSSRRDGTGLHDVVLPDAGQPRHVLREPDVAALVGRGANRLRTASLNYDIGSPREWPQRAAETGRA